MIEVDSRFRGNDGLSKWRAFEEPAPVSIGETMELRFMQQSDIRSLVAEAGQPHINLLIYQHVRGVTIIQANSKKGSIWKTDMDQYRFHRK